MSKLPVVVNVQLKGLGGVIAAGVRGVVAPEVHEQLKVAITERDLGMNRRARRAAKKKR